MQICETFASAVCALVSCALFVDNYLPYFCLLIRRRREINFNVPSTYFFWEPPVSKLAGEK